MEKSDKKRILTRVLIVIAALTLLSCCFLGSTFARYVTEADGTAQIGVAKWDVSVTPSADLDVSTNKLSPSKDAFASGTVRKHSTETLQFASFTNSGDVDATVTLTLSANVSLKNTDGNEMPLPATLGSENYQLTQADANAVFTLSLQLWTKEGITEIKPSTSGNTVTYTFALPKGVTGTGNDICILQGTITWTSDISGDESGEADKRDTLLGENVRSVHFAVDYSAVQNSELPTT